MWRACDKSKNGGEIEGNGYFGCTIRTINVSIRVAMHSKRD